MNSVLSFVKGSVRFKISGSRPGAFVNRLLKKGVGVKDIRSRGGEIYATCSLGDYREVLSLARGTSCRVHSIKKRGIPIIIYKNKNRYGLITGLICFAIIFKVLSMYIWTIDICRFDTINQTAASDILRRVGMYEGVRGDFESLKRMQTTAMLEFGNLSWITINADGCHGEVNATEKLPPATFDDAPRNLKARSSGQIIRVDTYRGTAAAASGDGIAVGDLLISGVVENADGTAAITCADGKVTARTQYTEVFCIPKEYRTAQIAETPIARKALRVFNVTVPLTLKTTPKAIVVLRRCDRLNCEGENVSVDLITEYNYEYNITQKRNTSEQAQETMRKKLLMRELFNYSERQINSREITASESKDLYIYTVKYSCEEDIAVPSPILVDRDDGP